MIDPRQHLPLLDDVIGHADADLAASSLRQTLAAARWRRIRRRLVGTASMVVLLGGLGLLLDRSPEPAPVAAPKTATGPRQIQTEPLPAGMLVRTQPGGLRIVSTQPGGFELVSTRPELPPFKLVDDDQLLTLAGRSAALVREVGARARLIFLGDAGVAQP